MLMMLVLITGFYQLIVNLLVVMDNGDHVNDPRVNVCVNYRFLSLDSEDDDDGAGEDVDYKLLEVTMLMLVVFCEISHTLNILQLKLFQAGSCEKEESVLREK